LNGQPASPIEPNRVDGRPEAAIALRNALQVGGEGAQGAHRMNPAVDSGSTQVGGFDEQGTQASNAASFPAEPNPITMS
jgi:hypothetical protein